MNEDFRKPSCLPRSDFPPYPFTKIDDPGPYDEPPAEVPKTVVSRVEGESRDVIGIDCVSDETASGVGVESDHEEECEVVGVPESLKTLVADLVVGGRVHDEHDEQHEVTGNATSLFVVNI